MRFYRQQRKFYCGIALHARKMYVCILDHAGKTKVHKNINTNPEAFFELIFPYIGLPNRRIILRLLGNRNYIMRLIRHIVPYLTFFRLSPHKRARQVSRAGMSKSRQAIR